MPPFSSSSLTRPAWSALGLLTMLGTVCGVRPAAAQTVRITATGTIQKVYDIDNSLNASVAVGTPFTFTYLFDYVPPTPEPNITLADVYLFPPPAFGALATVGDYTLSSSAAVSNSTATVSIAGQYPLSDIDFGSTNQTLAFGGKSVAYGGSSGIYLRDNQGRITTTGALPPVSAFTPSLYDPYAVTNQGTFFSAVFSLSPDDSVVWGRIDTLTASAVPAAVPEPAPLALLGLGALMLTIPARRARIRTA